MSRRATMNPNHYTRWAEYYDRDPRNLYSDDIAFYLNRAARFKGPVLELACGTGRVTLPFARAEFHITGLEHSRAMLDVFEKKLATESADVRANLELVQGDMAHFDLGQKFAFIFIPFRSFQALTTLEAQRACLACVQRHLAPDGEFILDVFRPKQRLDLSWIRPSQLDWTTVDPATGHTFSRHSVQKAIDPEKQVLDVDFTFILSNAAGVIDTFTESLQLAYFYEDQIIGLVEQAGFTISERYGYYDGTPIDSGSEIVLICQPKK